MRGTIPTPTKKVCSSLVFFFYAMLALQNECVNHNMSIFRTAHIPVGFGECIRMHRRKGFWQKYQRCFSSVGAPQLFSAARRGRTDTIPLLRIRRLCRQQPGQKRRRRLRRWRQQRLWSDGFRKALPELKTIVCKDDKKWGVLILVRSSGLCVADERPYMS
jgi:hypothetical protein